MKLSAGILLFLDTTGQLKVLLVHPGGPFWKNKDAGAWSIPKGEYTQGEDSLAAARREFQEELGAAPPSGEPIPLTPQRQSGGKLVSAWALRGNFDPAALKSNTVELEWPPKSGRMQEFPEIDRAAWFDIAEAREKILKGQLPFLQELEEMLQSS